MIALKNLETGINFADSKYLINFASAIGRIPEWPNGADCKSAGLYLRWFESIFAHRKSLSDKCQTDSFSIITSPELHYILRTLLYR